MAKKIVAPLPIVIEAVQYTPGRDPVYVQYTGHNIETGPFAKTQGFHTTQVALEEQSGTPGRGGDEDIYALLQVDLATHGINAEIIENVDPEIERQETLELARLQEIDDLEAKLADLRAKGLRDTPPNVPEE